MFKRPVIPSHGLMASLTLPAPILPSLLYTSATGCDSVVTLNLTIFEGDPPLPSFDVIAQLCIGDSVLIGPTDGDNRFNCMV
jgi:hypothetical protein